jgi:hypothetical protein
MEEKLHQEIKQGESRRFRMATVKLCKVKSTSFNKGRIKEAGLEANKDERNSQFPQVI